MEGQEGSARFFNGRGGVLLCPTDVLLCPADVLLCPTDVLSCSADVLLCPADVLLCPADVLLCSTDVLLCPTGQPLMNSCDQSWKRMQFLVRSECCPETLFPLPPVRACWMVRPPYVPMVDHTACYLFYIFDMCRSMTSGRSVNYNSTLNENSLVEFYTCAGACHSVVGSLKL